MLTSYKIFKDAKGKEDNIFPFSTPTKKIWDDALKIKKVRFNLHILFKNFPQSEAFAQKKLNLTNP